MKDINTKVSSRTESSHDARADHYSWCGENGHNAAWCPHNNLEEGNEHANMVYSGYNGNYNQPRRNEQYGNTYNPGVKHPNLSWRGTNVLQPNAPTQPPRQPYVPPFRQQQQPQYDQQQAMQRTSNDDAYATILKALNDMKEGSTRVESKLEYLSSKVRRLEAKEEQLQARQGRLPSQPEPAKTVQILQRGNQAEVNSNSTAFVDVVQLVQEDVAAGMK